MEKKHEIQTERLILRDLAVSDVNDWFEIFNSDKVGKILKKYDSKEDVANLINKKISKFDGTLGSSFSVEEKDSNKVIGSVEIKFDITSKVAEISYVFNEKYWNKGFATESARAILDYAFNFLKAEKVIANCKENNFASIKLLNKKLGMTLVACENNYMFYELTKVSYSN